jgi:putative acetyltransferase
MVEIRVEKTTDIEAIRQINDRAFGRPEEGRLVDRLRENCEDVVSLVGVLTGKVVGHILFSPVTIELPDRQIRGMGLGPIAVLPEHQNQGIGSQLITAGLKIIKDAGCPYVIVLGHETYYPRFGFVPASRYGIRCQWDGIPDAAFMVMEIEPGALAGISGVARYRDEFLDAM